MHFIRASVLSVLSLMLLSGVTAAPSTSPATISKSPAKRSCVNSASDRSCWGNYDTSTNYYDVVPDTGVTREYWFDVQNTTASPDGVERAVMLVNGTFPGPTIIAVCDQSLHFWLI